MQFACYPIIPIFSNRDPVRLLRDRQLTHSLEMENYELN